MPARAMSVSPSPAAASVAFDTVSSQSTSYGIWPKPPPATCGTSLDARSVGRAELDDLGAGRHDRRVPGRCVVGVTGRVGLGAAGEPEADASRRHHAPVRTLTTVIRQPTEE